MKRLWVPVVVILVVVTALVFGLALLLRSLAPSSWLALEQRVSRSVHSEILRVSETVGDRLELASVETREVFLEKDELDLGWLHLGTTEVELAVPAVYRFHVALAEGMKIEVKRHGDLVRCVVHAPRLRPTLPPAIRTEGLVKRSANGWARFNADERLAELERQLTAELTLRAREKVPLACESARTRLAGFVSRWLVKDGLWGGHDGVREIVVLFPGESDAVTSPSLIAPANPVVAPARP